MKNKFIISAILIIISTAQLFGSDFRTVKGKVVDNKDEVFIGATIEEYGNGLNYVNSDVNGEFEIIIPKTEIVVLRVAYGCSAFYDVLYEIETEDNYVRIEAYTKKADKKTKKIRRKLKKQKEENNRQLFNMKVNFEIATVKEVPEILKMMEQFNSIDNYPFDKTLVKANLFKFIADQNLGQAWVIKSDNLIIGYIILAFGFSFEHGGRDAFIDELFLKTEYRQKGIGNLAMDFIQEEAQRLEVKVVHLEVERHNQGGTKLYKEKGYKDNGRILLSKKTSDKHK